MAIDSTDGWLARRVRVADRAPSLDGTLLDNLVDYVTFVFVPAWVVSLDAVVPVGWGMPLAAAMLLVSAYGFSHREAKGTDQFCCFRGFPSYWNIVVFYLYALGLAPAVNGLIVAALCALVLAPIGFVYPSVADSDASAPDAGGGGAVGRRDAGGGLDLRGGAEPARGLVAPVSRVLHGAVAGLAGQAGSGAAMKNRAWLLARPRRVKTLRYKNQINDM